MMGTSTDMIGDTTVPGAARHVLPSAEDLEYAGFHLLQRLPEAGVGEVRINEHLNDHIVPALNRSSQSPNYYGFVTGGATPAASSADNIVTRTDQNVQVHLPKETIATEVEDKALSMLCELLDLPPNSWLHRTFTTGATASNVVGLACGREHIVQERAKSRGATASVAENGLIGVMKAADLDSIQVLTTVPHSSLRKAASIVGLGRASVIDVGLSSARHRFDMKKLEDYLRRPGVASIVAVSAAEVNTGLFATDYTDMQQLRRLCDYYGAWMHVDAAFGLLARVLPEDEEYQGVKAGIAGLELADSITGDAHKLLNVPYDCGIFLSKHLALGVDVFQNSNAAYLNTASSEATASGDRTIPSPLNIGIENSRRFRALPVYATLAAYGRGGYREMLERQIQLSRAIARLILQSKDYELLPGPHTDPPQSDIPSEARISEIYIIVLFCAKDDKLNQELVQRMNATRKLYVSGTQWNGRPAARFAVANWQVDVERDLKIVKEVLHDILQ